MSTTCPSLADHSIPHIHLLETPSLKKYITKKLAVTNNHPSGTSPFLCAVYSKSTQKCCLSLLPPIHLLPFPLEPNLFQNLPSILPPQVLLSYSLCLGDFLDTTCSLPHFLRVSDHVALLERPCLTTPSKTVSLIPTPWWPPNHPDPPFYFSILSTYHYLTQYTCCSICPGLLPKCRRFRSRNSIYVVQCWTSDA